MKTFNEWIIENHPEVIEEGWFKNLMAAGLIGASALGGMHMLQPSTETNPASATQQDTSAMENHPAYQQALRVFKSKGKAIEAYHRAVQQEKMSKETPVQRRDSYSHSSGGKTIKGSRVEKQGTMQQGKFNASSADIQDFL